ncbi:microtubule-associated protein 9 isoform X2 [Pantherophis guttatus]|uniref:Microtubule-associated protein 9 isoform X2 n=1 Tax=Pantherophis guttatus TaxID=94885 RepID=A0ABM3ZEQ7_PANGU|nr:microtubule-associated protein 9 isoform X2 [Pantherophis guttatus]
MSDEDIITTLAYNKSPKFSKRITFQEELQEALLARAINQQTEEYSEDFESDEYSEEEFPESEENICPKSAVFTVSSSKFNLCNRDTLKSESADDLSSTEEYEGSQYVSILERKILSKERATIPFSLTEHPGSCKRSTAKQSIPFEISLSNHYSFGKQTVGNLTLAKYEEMPQEATTSENKQLIKDTEDDTIIEERSNREKDYSHIEETIRCELSLEKKDMIQCKMESKPMPEQREFKTKAASASAENISIPALYDFSKPSPQPRSILRKSNHVEDYEGTKAEGRVPNHHRLFSLSAPSSETRLNDQMMKSERRALSESPGAEGPLIANSSSSLSIHFSLVNEKTGDSNLAISGNEISSKDNEHKEIDCCQDLRLPENDRKSPSVIELMMTTVYENTKKQYKSTEHFLEQKVQMLKPNVIEDNSIETPKDDKSKQKVALTTSKSIMDNSKDFVKEKCEEVEAVPQKAKIRSLSTTYLKKTGKYSPVPRSTSAQYLGTLKLLDNKHLQKYSAELDKADSLRAAVYQDWLEKKRIFLLELQRIKRNKAENLREKNEKKEVAKREEAFASFEAWKAMKEKQAKKLAEKKKLEAAKKKKEAELNEKKKEESQKAFEKWKKKKAAYLKQQMHKEKRVERLKKKEEQELVAEKRKDSRSAVEKWNEKKEEFMMQKEKEKIQERKKEVEQQVEKEEQDKRALDEYTKWLEKKEMDKSMHKKQKKLQVILEDETPPPWSPPGKAVSSRSY